MPTLYIDRINFIKDNWAYIENTISCQVRITVMYFIGSIFFRDNIERDTAVWRKVSYLCLTIRDNERLKVLAGVILPLYFGKSHINSPAKPNVKVSVVLYNKSPHQSA